VASFLAGDLGLAVAHLVYKKSSPHVLFSPAQPSLPRCAGYILTPYF
jgi:hypothetical protein